MNTDLQLRKQKSSLKGAPPDLKLGKSPTPVPMERLLMLEGKCPKHLFSGIEEASDSDTSFKTKKYDKESHSDSLLTVKCQL